jgi:inorganic pyrophosphatase
MRIQPWFSLLLFGISVGWIAAGLHGPHTQAKVREGDGWAENPRWVHPMHLPQAAACPEEVVAVIEIPQGSFTKYEIDPVSGVMMVDRFQSMPVAYPANYGVISSSLADDGDNLDVLVFSREPIVPGATIRVRPIGVLRMIDGGEQDDKVLAVPTDKVDPTYAGVATVEDLPPIELQRIEAFFRVYKQLPEGRKRVDLDGFRGADEARRIVDEAVRRYANGRQGD